MATTTLKIGQTATASLHEFKASGDEVAPIGPITHISDNESVATVSGDQVRAAGAGTCNTTGTDAGNNIVASTDLEVLADVAVSGKEVLSVN